MTSVRSARAGRWPVLPLLACSLALSACSKRQVIDFAMASAPHHPTPPGMRVGPYEVLAGDMHCHVLPPDSPHHVSRGLVETARVASDEGLDFVVLTPHVPARFFLDAEMREWVRGTQEILRVKARAIESAATGNRSPILLPGMEYTDGRFGHVGLGFADVDEVLDELPLDALLAKPSLFFETWRAHGGIATINHPMLRAIPQAAFMELRYDMSWRDFASLDRKLRPDVFPEIRWLSEHADAIETYNTSVGHLRDQFIVGDADWTMREGAHLVDRLARMQERRIAPVGGSDSHGGWLRSTTWVLASERTPAAIRDAIENGRTCVRGPEACTLEVRASDGAFHTVGAALATQPPPARAAIQARVHGGPATYFVNGSVAATGSGDETVAVPVPGTCALVRVVVGQSASAPVYVDCPWASSRGRGSSARP
jgi:hypothetical protein